MEENNLETKILLMAVIEDKEGKILMRKKPDGSPPYKETWYIFGCEARPGNEESETLTEYLKNDLGIKVGSVSKISEDSETKVDHDGIMKKFVYHDYRAIYEDGTVKTPPGIEKIEWI